MATLLKENRIDRIGTLRIIKKVNLKIVKDRRPKKRKITGRYSGSVCEMKWHENKNYV